MNGYSNVGNRALVHYQIATYSGDIEVPCAVDDDDDVLVARAKAKLKRLTSGCMYPGGPCYESWRVVTRDS